MDRQTEKQMDRWMDGQMDGWQEPLEDMICCLQEDKDFDEEGKLAQTDIAPYSSMNFILYICSLQATKMDENMSVPDEHQGSIISLAFS